jgi:hypothetical protein
MVIPLIVIRSITIPGCNAMLHTNLWELEDIFLYVGAVLCRLAMWY